MRIATEPLFFPYQGIYFKGLAHLVASAAAQVSIPS
jgi:hypothetical protein